jgi:hypothetical protein
VILDLATVSLPGACVWRVHRDPVALPQRQEPGEVAPNRFDDPLGRYRVRYLASTRRGAFLEVLAQFRRSDDAIRRLDSVRVVGEEPDPLLRPGWAPPRYVAALRMVRASVGPQHVFVDVAAPPTQTLLDRHPMVRRALDTSGLGTPQHPVQLDEATIRLAGPAGRSVTHAVSRAVFEDTNAGGIRYTSRLDVAEECWAVFEATPPDFDSPTAVTLDDADLVAAADALSVTVGTTLGGHG